MISKKYKYTAVTFVVLALCLLLTPSLTKALGLGALRVDSRIGEPLDLYIELLSPDPKDLASLSAGLASLEDFRRIGLPYPEQAETIRFQIEDNRAIRITSERPVDAAYLHFLVAATWAGGKVVREYTALLDPPLYKGRTSVESSLPVLPADGQIDEVARPVSAGSVGSPRPTSYRVKGGDNLSRIVRRLNLASGVSDQQAMMVLFNNNPKAFSDNINLLKQGATLIIPPAEEMAKLDPKVAQAEFSAQLSRSQNDKALPSDTAPTPASPVLEQTKAEADETPDSGNTSPAAANPVAEEEIQPDDRAKTDQVMTDEASGQNPASGDRLRIGQMPAESVESLDSGVPSAAAGGPELQQLRSRVRDLDESLVASHLENEELRETIRGIERQLAELTRLLTLENQTLALNQGVSSQAVEDQAGFEVVEPEEVVEEELVRESIVPVSSDTIAASVEEGKANEQSALGSIPDSSTAVTATAESESGALPEVNLPPSGAPTASPGELIDQNSEPVTGDTSGTTEELTTANDQSTLAEVPDGSTAVAAKAESESGAPPEMNPPPSGEPDASAKVAAQSALGQLTDETGSTTLDTGAMSQSETATVDTESPLATKIGQPLESSMESVAAEEASQEMASTATETGAETSHTDADDSSYEDSGVTRSVSNRGVADSLKEIPQLALGTFQALPETERRIVGGVGVLVGGLAALGLVRRRRSRKPTPPRSRVSLEKGSAPSALGSVAASGGIALSLDDDKPVEEIEEAAEQTLAGADPLAEAEAYVAYDHDDQAIRVLQDAWERKPEEAVGLKLLELHHKHGDRRAFSGLAETLYLQIGGDSPAWSEIAVMGRKLNPENPLFAASEETEAVAVAEMAKNETAEGKERTKVELDEIGLDDLQPLQSESQDDMQHSLEESGLSLREEIGDAQAENSQELGEAGSSDETGGSAVTAAVQRDALSPNQGGDELESALELAEAYLDLGEKEVAQSFIDEVTQNGTDRQKQLAAKLAEKLD